MAAKVKKPEKKGKGWIFPIPSKRQTQGFGSGHHGRDYGVPTGTPLVAPTKGRVVYAGKNNQGYGNLIEIQTDDGKTVYLAHLSQINVRMGQTVQAGQLIGKTGNTGNSTGPHLHLEVRQGSKQIDPLSLYTGGQPFMVTKGAGKQDGSKNISPYPGTRTAQDEGQAEALKGQQEAMAASPLNMIEDWISGLNWGNVIAAVAGILLITVGVLGLVTGEAAKTALQPLTEALKS